MYRVILLALMSLYSCGQESHYDVESVGATAYYLDTSYWDEIDVLVTCDTFTKKANYQTVIGLSADLSYSRRSGTFEPGILGIKNPIIGVGVYKKFASRKEKIELKAVAIDKYVVLKCNDESIKNSPMYYSVGLRKRNNIYENDTLIYKNVFFDKEDYESYTEFLNNENLSSRLNYYYLVEGGDIKPGDSIQVILTK